MAGKLVTIATFELPLEAHIARNALVAANIPVTLDNEESSTLFGQGTNVMSGVRVVVREEDEEAAVKVLDATFGSEEPVSAEELAARAEETEPEDPVPPAKPESLDEEGQPLSERDRYARRAWLAAIFGLVVPFLWFYAVYLFLNAAFGDGPLSDRSKGKLFVAGGPVFLVVLVLGFPFALFALLFLVGTVGSLLG